MEKVIAILEGDGIGPEIVREAIKVLNAVESKYGHKFTLNKAPFGAGAYFTEGSPFPEKTKLVCDEADAILKGPIGLAVEKMCDIPQEHRPEQGALLPLRKRYDTFANFRPVRLPKELASFSPLKESVIGDGIDIIMIRELVGGIYFGDKIEGSATGMKYAKDECSYTYEQIERVARVAFEEAQKRNVKLSNIHKSNVLATSRFWNEIVENVAKKFPDVTYSSVLVDNAAFQLIKNPTQFNGVMLMENMQGDILTDQGGGIVGSLGLLPSVCVGPEKCYAEAAHGSAPDIAGKNIANPFSIIGSVGLLLEKSFNLQEEAEDINNSLFKVFKQGFVTEDLKTGNNDKILSTDEFGDRVVANIQSK
ncbi:MAG: 3-isopropylmalate dehydrogenase [Candidatus Anammoxibacter sp.]